MEVNLLVSGMTCADCSERVEKKLVAAPGVQKAVVSVMASKAMVAYDAATTSPEELIRLVKSIGFDADVMPPASSASLRLEASSLSAGAVTAAVAALQGVGGVSKVALVSDSTPSATPVTALEAVYDPMMTGARKLLAIADEASGAVLNIEAGDKSLLTDTLSTIAGAGVWSAVLPPSTSAKDAASLRTMYQRTAISCTAAAVAAIIAYAVPHGEDSRNFYAEFSPAVSAATIVQLGLATIVEATVGWPIGQAAWLAAVKSQTMTMDTLVTLSSSVAYVYSIAMMIVALAEPVFETSSILLALVMVGRAIEHSAKKRTASALRKLMTSEGRQALLVEVPGSAASCCSSSGDSCCKPDGSCSAPKQESCCKPSAGGCGTSAASSASTCCAPAPACGAATAPVDHFAAPTRAIPSCLIQLNDILRVPPHNPFPCDGVVVSGSTAADEALVTGESVPVPKAVGATVVGGSMNCEGVAHMQVSALPGAGAVARVVALVEEAQGARPPIQLVADRVAAIFTPAICALAVAAFCWWYGLAASGTVDTDGVPPGSFALLFSLALLVVSCPCAVSLAVPTAVMVATSVATQFGALVKGGPALEALTTVGHVVLDKTGTLTTGQLRLAAVRTLVPDRMLVAAAKSAGIIVDRVLPSSAQEEDSIRVLSSGQAAALAVAAAAEAGSTHPLALAVLSAAAARVQLKVLQPSAAAAAAKAKPAPKKRCGMEEEEEEDSCGGGGSSSGDERVVVPGRGVRAVLTHPQTGSSTSVIVGSLPFCREEAEAADSGDSGDNDFEAIEAVGDELAAAGMSALAVVLEGQVLALLGCKDSVRPEAAAVVQKLQASRAAGGLGMQVWIASGDNAGAVAAAAAAVCVPPHRALWGLSPAGKAAALAAIREGRSPEPAALVSTRYPQFAVSAAVAEVGSVTVEVQSPLPASAAAAASGVATPAAATPSPSPSPSTTAPGWRSLVKSVTGPPAPRTAVLMVGDGINDAPALSAADVGVALSASSGPSAAAGAGAAAGAAASSAGALGVAAESADIVLQQPQLTKLLTLFRLATATKSRIKQNFGWAFLYNALAMPLAAGVLYPATHALVIPPSVAGLSELFSSVPVVVGSLLLYRFDHRETL